MIAGALLWLVATLLEATILTAQEGVVFVYAAASSGVKYGVLAVLAWPLMRVSARLVLADRRVVVATHAVMGLVIITVWQAAYYAFLYLQLGSLTRLRLEQTLWWQALNALLIYAVLAAGVSAVQTSRRLTTEQARRAELTLLACEAELTSLKAQLRPHFLFNTLNSIYSLIETRPDEARDMVALLGDLLRQTLDASDAEVVPLESEIRIIETYLGIEKLRFGDRLDVQMDLSPESARCLVPPLILQPLIENAVKHGVAPSVTGGTVHVRARAFGGVLELLVRDSGPGFAGNPDGEGRGLDITRRRLRAMYGDHATLSVGNGASRGGEVRLRLPATTASEPTGEPGRV